MVPCSPVSPLKIHARPQIPMLFFFAQTCRLARSFCIIPRNVVVVHRNFSFIFDPVRHRREIAVKIVKNSCEMFNCLI